MKSTHHPHSDYPPQAYALLSKAENVHFWFRGRNAVIRDVIIRTFPAYAGKHLLEVGCGTGYVLTMLDKMKFRLTGIDMHPEGLKYAKKRVPNATYIHDNVFTHSSRTKYDAIGIFDVIEHIENDRKALEYCAALLKSHGRIFLTVPARMELWSAYDEVSGHKRRYTKESLSGVFQKSGFRVLYIEYFGFFQYFPHLCMKRFALHKTDGKLPDTMTVLRKVVWQPPPLLNWLLERSFDLDMFISRYIRLPFGTSLIVSAEKAV